MQPEPRQTLFSIRHPFVRIENLLSEREIADLLPRVLALEPQFQSSVALNVTNPDDVRKSLVFNPPADLVRPVVDKVRAMLAAVLTALRLPPIHTAEIESQITASNDGAFYGVHTDADYAQMHRRYLTYVYYFNYPPKAFTGGELFLFDDVLRNNKLAMGDTYQAVQPEHNTMVLFWARIMHEVRPVSAPSKAVSRQPVHRERLGQQGTRLALRRVTRTWRHGRATLCDHVARNEGSRAAASTPHPSDRKNIMPKFSWNPLRLLCAVTLVAAIAACAGAPQSAQQTESLLTSAGFKTVKASTATQLQHLPTLPQGQVTMVTQTGKYWFVYPDLPKNQIYVGTEKEYQAYLKLSGAAGASNGMGAQIQKQDTAMTKYDNATAGVIWESWPSFTGLQWGM